MERSAIEALVRRLPPAPPGETWIGDDAAVVGADGLLLAADVVVEGVHFDLDLVGLGDVGWKALAVNVSDIAAMGGEPGHALVSVVVPPGCDLDRLYDGLLEAAAAYGCPIVGGDLSAGERLVVSVALTGSVDGPPGPVLRSGARPGDALVVTGALGAAAAAFAARPVGHAHRRPVARLAEGRTARLAGATALMDLSDGLALDLRRLAEASGVGVVVDEVPVAPGASLEQALGGGEDYELLAAIDPADVARLPGWLVIGRCTGDPDERRLGDADLPEGGWEHSW